MKKLFFQVILFVLISSVAIYVTGEVLYIIISNTGRNIINDTDFKVTEAVCRSRKKIKTKKLVLGDSVGDSLYGNCIDSCVYSLTATVAITTAGQYCLLQNFLVHNKGQYPEEVILIYNPISWNNILSGGLCYSLFAKQFYNNEFKHYLDKKELDRIAKWPYSFLLNEKWFRLSPYTVNVKDEIGRGVWISEMQYRYIHKMQSICEMNGIKFKLLSGPVRESLRDQVDNIAMADEKAYEPIFREYFEQIIYMPDECFIDKLHLKPSYIPNDIFKLYDNR